MNRPTTQNRGRQARRRPVPVWLVIATLLAIAAAIVAVLLLWPNLLHPDSAAASDRPTNRRAAATPAEQDMDPGRLPGRSSLGA